MTNKITGSASANRKRELRLLINFLIESQLPASLIERRNRH